MKEIQEEMQEALVRVRKDDYSKCFQEWEKGCDKCAACQVDYFEGD